jgi:GxxExxY protein
MTEILYKNESYNIISSCMKVHSGLGPGFTEPVYQEALEKQFLKDLIPYEREKLLNVYYDGQKLKKHFKADFVCYGNIIVELKAAILIHSDNLIQAKSYLKSTNFQLGIIVNFGQKSLVFKRVINLPPSCNSL